MSTKTTDSGLVLCGKVLIDCGTLARRAAWDLEDEQEEIFQQQLMAAAANQTLRSNSDDVCSGLFNLFLTNLL
jgi:hypothetical protein